MPTVRILLIWLAVQWLTLCVAAGRVPLSAKFSRPIEQRATAEMAFVQVATAALIFPLLLANWTQTTLAIASAWPMLVLASRLGGEDSQIVVWTGLDVTIWVILLSAWRRAFSTRNYNHWLISVASLWALGGPILVYIRMEFGPGISPHFGLWNAIGGPELLTWLDLTSAGDAENVAHKLPIRLILLALILLAFSVPIVRAKLSTMRSPSRSGSSTSRN